MKSIAFIILFSFLFNSLALSAQDYPRKNIDPSQIADELFGFQDQDLNYDDIYENALQLLSNPININLASAEELRFLKILSETQIQSLIAYRKENGALQSIYELQAVPDFDMATIYRFVQFVKVPDPTASISHALIKRALYEENNFIITRYERTFERKKGYDSIAGNDRQFKGSPDKLYLRLRTSRPGDFSFGLTAEKDAGEQLAINTSSHQYLFDFLSYHAQIQNKGRLKNMVVGDYQSQFAQGLMFGGGFGMGKGAETVTTTRRANIGFTPYTSANEFGLQRGIATTYEITKNVYISTFFSRIKRDANLNGDEDDDVGISSFQLTGLHRNNAELEDRKKIKEINTGVIIHYNHNRIDAGVMYNYLKFNNPVNSKTSLYNQFAFSGTQNKNVGAYVNYNYKNFLVFAEVSKSMSAGMGGVVGITGTLTPRLDISLLYRKYNRNYYSFYTNAFSEGTMPQNELGIYSGWRYSFNKKFTLTGYMDFFRFPWLRFRSYKPSNGQEWLARFSYQPSKLVQMFVQMREEKKVRNISHDPSLYQTAEGMKRNYWINFTYELVRHLKMKTRAQFSTYQIDDKTTSGSALIQDISVDFGKLECTARYALFDTEDFDNRQYAYEQDVWLAYSLPSYYGTGVRNFVLLEYRFSKKISFWLRYGRTRYTNTDSIGSGLDQIAGNTKTDIKFQLRLKL
jgi:hypothetical protein